MRYDLWKTLLQAAQLAGVEILFEEEEFKCVHADEGVITVETRSGVHHTRLLIAADGHKSVIRSSLLPEQQLNFLGTVIVSCTFSSVVAVPDFIRNHHGFICAPLSVNGSPSSMFVADEGSERLLVSLAFPSAS
jgi:2-polyprenyl-6-methoxyphenol hydroxylase-like FAD-dependent oxidoreductase